MEIPTPIFKRKLEDKLVKFLDDETAIAVHGARQVGKTYILYSLIRHLEAEKAQTVYLDLEDPLLLTDLNQGYQNLLKLLLARGVNMAQKVYVLIDEIQYLDNPSSFIKLLADHHKTVHLIVSGSSTFAVKSKFKDSLAGRIVDFELFPLDFEEYLSFKGLKYDLAQVTSTVVTNELIGLYQEFVRFGGYPRISLTDSVEKKKVYLNQIIDNYLRKDIRDLGRIENLAKFNSLLFVLASQSGQMLNVARLSKETGISVPTLDKYLFLLEETYILKLVTPFSKNPHVEIVKSPKIFFYDSGLAGLLWLRDFPQTVIGNLFETSVFSQYVKKYSKSNLFYWRTKNKQEIDLVYNMMPIEVKLNFDSIDRSAINSYLSKYRISQYCIVGLLGSKKPAGHIYPWEI